MNRKKIVFITGATSGFGKAIAYKYAEEGYDLILNGRREDRLKIIEKELTDLYKIKIISLVFDVRDSEKVSKAINGLPPDSKKIDILVNNAGLAAGLSTIQEGDINDWNTMIDTNIKGLLYVSRIIMPFMIANKSGHIINIGSIAGKEAYLRGNIYCATKFAVDAFTKSMRIDLLEHGI